MRAGVGVEWRQQPATVELGSVPAPEVAQWLLRVAGSAAEVSRVAFLAANAAQGVRNGDQE